MNKRIRILFTISNFDTAGSGKVVYDLIYGLDKSKFDIEIACGNDTGDFFKIVRTLGIPIHIFETKTAYRPYYSLFLRIFEISKFYRKQQYDIVHSWQWSSDWTEALAARLVKKKWMYTKKAMGFQSKHWKIKSCLANFIVTINEEMRNYFPYKKNQKLIPLGIDTEYYSPKLFETNALKEDSKFQIITVANLVPVKGIEILIEAVNKLKNKNVILTILGDNDNDYGNAMKALSQQLMIGNQVHFIDKQLDVRPYISQSDVFVIPTLDHGRREGMPMALVEAMCMSIPVIGSDISGINFVLKDFRNLLVKAGDSDNLCLKLQEIMSLKRADRIKIGKALRMYCLENFTMNAFVEGHECLYAKLMKS